MRITTILLLISSSLTNAQVIFEGTSKPVKFGASHVNTKDQTIHEGISNPIYFYTRLNADVFAGQSAPVRFGEQATSVKAEAVKPQLREVARDSGAKEDEQPVEMPKQVPNYYALVIGVSTYKNANANFASLDRPVKDAEELSRTLAASYVFKPENIKLLKDPTHLEILDAIDGLSSQLNEKDNLLVFYAGHGYWDENLKVGYWLASDAVPDKKSTWISNSIIKDYIGGIKTKHTLLITDACFSGSIFKSRGGESLNTFSMARLYQLPSRKAMTSGNLKTVPDQSKFFDYLNKRLKENKAQYLSARELFNSLYTAVLNNTTTVPLYGVIQDTGDEGGEFIFIRK